MAVSTDFGRFNTLGMPPDSTGKLMGLIRTIVVEYSTAVGTFSVGDELSGGTSSFRARITTSVAFTATTGQLGLIAERGLAGAVTKPVVGETLTDEFGSTCVVVDVAEIYVSGGAIVSGDNPFNAVRVDGSGNIFTRFTEGEQQLSSFGLTRTTQPNPVASYTFLYGIRTYDWSQVSVGAGAIVPIANEVSVAVDAGIGATDLGQLTTNNYHQYPPAQGLTIAMTVTLGDLGRANNARNWGVFDDLNGLFFQLDNTDFNLVIRSNTTGTPVDSVIPRSTWNGDRLDGSRDAVTNLSGFDITLTNINIFWIDYQWLGAGRVRFGVYTPDGERVVCHSEEHASTIPTPYMGQPTLPVRVESRNSGVTSAPSRLKLTCAAVATDGPVTELNLVQNVPWTEEVTTAVTSSNTETPVITFRPKVSFSGKPNRRIQIPRTLGMRVKTNAVIVRLRRASTLSGASFAAVSNPEAAAEVDTSATFTTPGELIRTFFVEPGTQDLDLTNVFSVRGRHMRLNSDNSQTDTISISIESADAGSHGDVQVSVGWTESNS